MEKTFIPKETTLKFKQILKAQISAYYKYVIKKEKEICAFGIFTDSDISSFVLYYLTQSRLDAITNAGIKWNQAHPDNTAEIDADKWWMPEWASIPIQDKKCYDKDDRYSALEKIMDEFSQKSNWDIEDTKNTFATYKKEMFDAFCEVLKALKEAQLFKAVHKDFFLLVQESDNGIYEDRAISLKKIMTKQQFDTYLKVHEA